MDVGPLTTTPQPQPLPETHSNAPFVQSNSTLEGMQPIPVNKTAPLLARIFNFLKEKFTFFFNWVRSLFSSPPNPKAVEKEVEYFKVVGVEEGKVKYRLILNGERTANEIVLGKTVVPLELISFPDQQSRDKLPEMISLIMETENKDCIRTPNLKDAKALWECGLKTGSFINFNLQTQDPLTKLMKEILQQVVNVKLNDPARRALNRLEDQIMQCIVSEQASYNSDPTNKGLHQSIDDTFNGSFNRSFEPSLVRARIDEIEQIIGHSFDLQALIQRAKGKKDDQYFRALTMIPLEKGNQERASSWSFWPRSSTPASKPFELELLLDDLFILMDATKIPMSRAIIQNFPNLIFSKKV